MIGLDAFEGKSASYHKGYFLMKKLALCVQIHKRDYHHLSPGTLLRRAGRLISVYPNIIS